MGHIHELQGATPDAELGQAATVALLRDGGAGMEVLLVERPHNRGSFAGAWVFPGGGIDDEDRMAAENVARTDGGASAGPDVVDPAEAVARVAAVREVREECGLDVSPSELVALSCWTPPVGIPKRMHTWFFIAMAPAGPIRLAIDEVVDYRWIRPDQALAEHTAGGLNLTPPTWVTLSGLARYPTGQQAISAAKRRGTQQFGTRVLPGEAGSAQAVLWQGDVAYDDPSLIDTDGPRHRLSIGALPWLYDDGGANE